MQIIDGDMYAERASGQHRAEIVTRAPRGAILDRDGYRLALTEQARTIGATPSLVTDPAAVVAAVAEASGESPDVIMDRLTGGGRASRTSTLRGRSRPPRPSGSRRSA